MTSFLFILTSSPYLLQTISSQFHSSSTWPKKNSPLSDSPSRIVLFLLTQRSPARILNGRSLETLGDCSARPAFLLTAPTLSSLQPGGDEEPSSLITSLFHPSSFLLQLPLLLSPLAFYPQQLMRSLQPYSGEQSLRPFTQRELGKEFAGVTSASFSVRHIPTFLAHSCALERW